MIADAYWSYLWQQHPLNILFGGNFVGTHGIGDFVLAFLPERLATHNTQLDLLLGVGCVGWALVTLAGLVAFYRTFALYRKTQDGVYAALFAVKVTVVVFSFSLSFFPGWMIFLLYFLDPTPEAARR